MRDLLLRLLVSKPVVRAVSRLCLGIAAAGCIASPAGAAGAMRAINQAGVLYVNADSTANVKDGYSWATALPHLDDALAMAKAENTVTPGVVKQIWITSDSYVPTRRAAELNYLGAPTTPLDMAFVLVDGVDIIGGFSGTETGPDQRPQPIVPTTLTAPSAPPSMDSPYHVVICAANLERITLNSIAIQWGFAPDASPNPRIVVNGKEIGSNGGGGLYAADARLNLDGVTFYGNGGFGGGGLFADNSDIIASGVVFDYNLAVAGGAVLSKASQLTMTNAIMLRNTAQHGSALYCSDTNGYLTNVTVTGNTAMDGTSPSALYLEYSYFELRNSLLLGNGSADIIANSLVPSHAYFDGVYHKPGGNVAVALTPPDVFMNPGTPVFASADYHLKEGTLAVNGGDSTLYAPGQTPDISSITRDLDGHPRFQGTSIDLGAYEGNTSAVEPWELY